jgi:hypothetical protein
VRHHRPVPVLLATAHRVPHGSKPHFTRSRSFGRAPAAVPNRVPMYTAPPPLAPGCSDARAVPWRRVARVERFVRVPRRLAIARERTCVSRGADGRVRSARSRPSAVIVIPFRLRRELRPTSIRTATRSVRKPDRYAAPPLPSALRQLPVTRPKNARCCGPP